MTSFLLIGLISDTHGLIRPEALAALRGSDMILHAGDVGTPEVLEALRSIAPVHAVRGNVDTEDWASALPGRLIVPAGTRRILLVHRRVDAALQTGEADVVLYGHSHKHSIAEEAGILWVNPGSAGPRRFRLPITCGRLRITKGSVTAEILPLASS